eukprot:Gregarina_sp_Poly_1__1199@NODE_1294_length_4466_cov_41_127074_g249_i2_p1_GENE_NODE_1294_length_4466_cov_41_127074_g249_i2NODE_1294_length_4466_cov_41_127074_g249_i2_p1_ORF_typecomplete_len416_score61_12_NODE_1294_length_4466_cov_41_127074_g249_i223683615
MQPKASIVGILNKVDWRGFLNLILNAEYSRAFNILGSLWQPAWMIHNESGGDLSSTDRDALAFLVLYKAFISFKCNLLPTTNEELDLAVKLYGWSGMHELWLDMSKFGILEGVSRDILVPFMKSTALRFWQVPFPVFWMLISLSAEIGESGSRIERLMKSFYLFSSVSQSTAFQKAKEKQLWNETSILMAQECSLFRAVDVLTQLYMPQVGLDLLNLFSASYTVVRPSVELMKVKLALESGKHEEAVSIMHKIEQVDALCGQVAKAYVCQSVKRGDSGMLFRNIAAQLKNLDDTSSEFVRHCMKNNEAVSLIHEGKFVGAFVAIYESLATFLPVGITGDAKSATTCPDVERVPMDTSNPGRVIALPLLFQNALMLNEFLPLAQSRNVMIKELALARRIEDPAILQDVFGMQIPEQ